MDGRDCRAFRHRYACHPHLALIHGSSLSFARTRVDMAALM
jgi:hypothetical protein